MFRSSGAGFKEVSGGYKHFVPNGTRRFGLRFAPGSPELQRSGIYISLLRSLDSKRCARAINISCLTAR